ncbi:glycoside hydrolase family 2 protein [Zasmidium cellare ATCC 36951]|uniref:Beta-mannosidase A n=1 Tax=Zasmidium cellare ATCC 36951 TaxID=1080233 RepID=A0A6A6D0J0_ZASCE|nr:glycoside hydrolase family 2 protein [Zasmidium cellare ATCC 36951]KAF2172881.1 glycoside hydrolase family 2 protein [Zasmidium cellare ATCC 36951]
MRVLSKAFLLSCLTSLVSSQNIVSLVGSDWTLSNDALNISVPAELPSYAQLDLYADQVIGDPLYGRNNFNLRWIVWSNWTYTSAPIQGLSSNASSTWLLFNGLDTFTSISFCGEHVASTNNQFRQYWFDVSDILRSCGSQDKILSINFGSAANIANDIANEPGQETWPDGVNQLYQFVNRNFVRKEQSDFGWDWGPAFVPAGPWQPAWVVQLGQNEVQVRNSLVDIYRQGQLNNLPAPQGQPWVVNASLDYFGSLPQGASLTYKLTSRDNETTVSTGSLGDVNTTASTVTGSTTLPSDAVELWWPVGMGDQNLYYMTVDLVSAANQTLATVTKRVGFRTIILNGNPVSDEELALGIAPGNNWHFEVNGQPFFAKGSNFIPPDAFWTRVTPKRISDLFDTAIAGNQNMLRVWSSGAYAPDFMYDLADEKGLLLWSEFEFGCSLYPVYQEFLDNVREEAGYQVRRVNHHPSLTLWAGGNEMENLELATANETAPEEFPRLQAEYETLFLGVLLPAVYGNSRSISYQPSSTSNGWLYLNHSAPMPMIQRYNNKTEGAVYGESDYYNYNPSFLGNTSSYPVARFSNEFGFHSMPSLQSWRQQIAERDLQFNSTTILLRNQHNPPGNLNITNLANSSTGQYQMTEAIMQWLPIPNKTDSVANFSAWCHATQIFQAQFYTSQIEFYRRGAGLPNRNLGSLYWQLEDIWVAPTWAGVEYDGRWKMLHYAAKDRYEPIIIAPYYNRTTGNLTAWVSSDLWTSAQGTATFTWLDWAGNELTLPNTTKSVDFTVGGLNSTQVLQTFTTSLPDPNNTILKLSVSAQGSLPNSNQTQTFKHSNWFTPTGLNTAKLGDPGLELSYSEVSRNFTVTATQGVAAYVWLDYPSGAVAHFDDNGFWLGRGERREVGYTVVSDATSGRWVEGVTVQSIWNQTLAM